MLPTGDYKRFKAELFERYEDYDIPITYGILIADARQSRACEYILNYLNIFHRFSGEAFDFFIPGYSQNKYNGQRKVEGVRVGQEKYYFYEDDFDDFIINIRESLGIRYTYNPMLVLAEKQPNKSPDINDKKIVIELDRESDGIERSGILFEEIFDIAKREVQIDKHRFGLTKLYLKKHILDEIVSSIDNKFIQFLHNISENMKRYKIKKDC